MPVTSALMTRLAAAAPRLLALAALAGGLSALGRPLPGSAAETTGAGQNLQAIDGDTLQNGSDILQLYGFDAPELGQVCLRAGKPWQCGLEAAFTLQKLLTLSGSPVVCEAWHDGAQTAGAHGELIRVCWVGRDQDLAMSMLRNGYGMAVPGSFPYYGQLERQAREAGLGIWSSEFTAPWEWRQDQRLRGGGADQPGADCNVKGRMRGGLRIYLVPTDTDYQDAAADAADGEHRFCSDEAARGEGWRRAGESETNPPR
jgi:endonuclease YncB( thermonuclease family)